MNSVLITGRLVRNVECKYTQSQMAVAQFTVAVNRPKKNGEDNGADFPRCIAFGKTAENLEKFTSKGRLIAVQGRIQTGSYKNKNGDTVYTTDVIADRVEFLEYGDKMKREIEDYAEPIDEFEAIAENVPF